MGSTTDGNNQPKALTKKHAKIIIDAVENAVENDLNPKGVFSLNLPFSGKKNNRKEINHIFDAAGVDLDPNEKDKKGKPVTDKAETNREYAVLKESLHHAIDEVRNQQPPAANEPELRQRLKDKLKDMPLYENGQPLTKEGKAVSVNVFDTHDGTKKDDKYHRTEEHLGLRILNGAVDVFSAGNAITGGGKAVIGALSGAGIGSAILSATPAAAVVGVATVYDNLSPNFTKNYSTDEAKDLKMKGTAEWLDKQADKLFNGKKVDVTQLDPEGQEAYNLTQGTAEAKDARKTKVERVLDDVGDGFANIGKGIGKGVTVGAKAVAGVAVDGFEAVEKVFERKEKKQSTPKKGELKADQTIVESTGFIGPEAGPGYEQPPVKKQQDNKGKVNNPNAGQDPEDVKLQVEKITPAAGTPKTNNEVPERKPEVKPERTAYQPITFDVPADNYDKSKPNYKQQKPEGVEGGNGLFNKIGKFVGGIFSDKDGKAADQTNTATKSGITVPAGDLAISEATRNYKANPNGAAKKPDEFPIPEQRSNNEALVTNYNQPAAKDVVKAGQPQEEKLQLTNLGKVDLSNIKITPPKITIPQQAVRVAEVDAGNNSGASEVKGGMNQQPVIRAEDSQEPLLKFNKVTKNNGEVKHYELEVNADAANNILGRPKGTALTNQDKIDAIIKDGIAHGADAAKIKNTANLAITACGGKMSEAAVIDLKTQYIKGEAAPRGFDMNKPIKAYEDYGDLTVDKAKCYNYEASVAKDKSNNFVTYGLDGTAKAEGKKITPPCK